MACGPRTRITSALEAGLAPRGGGGLHGPQPTNSRAFSCQLAAFGYRANGFARWIGPVCQSLGNLPSIGLSVGFRHANQKRVGAVSEAYPSLAVALVISPYETEGPSEPLPASVGKLKCFVISAFGKTQEEKRASKQVLKHLIGKVLEPRGYAVERADQIAEEGLITNQIIERLLDVDLVVADLTGLNPNVFYEMAVRHAARKPIIHVITVGVEIPFDVSNMRAVQYSLTDPDRLEEAQQELNEKTAAIEGSGWKAAANPITAARDVAVLLQSNEPEVREHGEVLAAVSDLKEEIQQLNRRVARLSGKGAMGKQPLQLRIRKRLRRGDKPEFGTVASDLAVSFEDLQEVMERMEARQEIRYDGGWVLAS